MPIRKKKLIGALTIALALTLLAGYVIVSQSTRSIRFMSGTKSNACINNLRQIDGAKQQWAIEEKKTPNDVPTTNDLAPYIKSFHAFQCEAGGHYKINAVKINPECSHKEHGLPEPVQ